MTTPAVIMFIRHGEKPASSGPPHGVNHHGEHDEHSLAVRGWTRAGALAHLFAAGATAAQPAIVVPERVLATQPSGSYRSRREVDTATPVAGRLGLPVEADFDHGQVHELSSAVLGDPRSALVVWHHGSMRDLVAAFPLVNADDLPEAWPDDRYDLIWVLTRESDGPGYRFTAVAQQVLAGDPSSA